MSFAPSPSEQHDASATISTHSLEDRSAVRLVAIVGRSVLRFNQGGISVPFDDNTTTFVGPSGSGKTTLLRLVELVLRCAEQPRSPQSLAPFNSSINQGQQQTSQDGKPGRQSGVSSTVKATAAIVWKFREQSAYRATGCHQRGDKSPAQFYHLEFDNTKDNFLEKFEEALKSSSDAPRKELQFLVNSIIIVPQDHGLRPGPFDAERTTTPPYLCSKAALFGESGHQEVFISSPVADGMLSICDVTLHKRKFTIKENVLQRQEGSVYSLLECSGGQWDCFFSLCGIYGFNSKQPSIVILDEPGQNLGSFQRSLLRQQLTSAAKDRKLQIAIVTHHVEMLDRETLPDNVVSLSIHSTVWGGRRQLSRQVQIQPKIILPGGYSSSFEKMRRWLWADLSKLSAFFAPGLLIVEGEGDLQAIDCIDQILKKWPPLVTALGMENYRGFKWRVFPGKGARSLLYIQELARLLNMPCLVLRDLDEAFEQNSARTSQYSLARADGSPGTNSQKQRSKDVQLGIGSLTAMGGHASACFDQSNWRARPKDLPKDWSKQDLPKSGKQFFERGLVCWLLRLADYVVDDDSAVEQSTLTVILGEEKQQLKPDELLDNMLKLGKTDNGVRDGADSPSSVEAESSSDSECARFLRNRSEKDQKLVKTFLARLSRAHGKDDEENDDSLNIMQRVRERVRNVKSPDYDSDTYLARILLIVQSLRHNKLSTLADGNGPWAMPLLDVAAAHNRHHRDVFWPPAVCDIEGLFVQKGHLCTQHFPSMAPTTFNWQHPPNSKANTKHGRDNVLAAIDEWLKTKTTALDASKPSSGNPDLASLLPSIRELDEQDKQDRSPSSSQETQQTSTMDSLLRHALFEVAMNAEAMKNLSLLLEAGRELSERSGKTFFYGASRLNAAMAAAAVKKTLNLEEQPRGHLTSFFFLRLLSDDEGLLFGLRLFFRRLLHAGAIDAKDSADQQKQNESPLSTDAFFKRSYCNCPTSPL